MRVGIFGREHNPVMAAVAEGARECGWLPEWCRPSVFRAAEAKEYDLVVTLGTRKTAGPVIEHYRSRSVPVLVADLGRLRRDLGYWYLGRGALDWLPSSVPFEKYGRRADHLDLPPHLAPPDPGAPLLLLGQVPGDAAHGMLQAQLIEWYEGAIEDLKVHSDRPVLFRPHPEAGAMLPRNAAGLDGNESLLDALENCYAAVTFNSTAGLEALLLGRAVLADTSAYYWPWTIFPEELEDDEAGPPGPTRCVKELEELVSWSQFTLEEIGDGWPLRFVLDGSLMPPEG